ncbi:MAG: hypothetical protein ABEJ56_03275 [Candidatus Nanohaloarchaea archaeon]
MEILTPEEFLRKYSGKKIEDIEISEELKQLKGSAEKLSEEERQRRKKELEEMDSEELAEKFGLGS